MEYDFKGKYEAEPVQELAKMIKSGYAINMIAHSASLMENGRSLEIEILQDKEAVDVILARLNNFYLDRIKRAEFLCEVLLAYGSKRAGYEASELNGLLDRDTFDRQSLVTYVNRALQNITDHHDSQPLEIFKVLTDRKLIDPDEKAYEWAAGKTHELFTLAIALTFIAHDLEAEGAASELVNELEEFALALQIP